MRLLFSVITAIFLVTLATSQTQGEVSKDAKDAAEAKAKLLRHPLDPLSEDEMKLLRKLLLDMKLASRRAVFALITLHEPKKEDVLMFKPGDPFERRAKAVFYEPMANETYEVVINLTSKTQESRKVVNKQSPSSRDDGRIAERLLRTNLEWQAAIRKRGLDPIDIGIGTMSHRGYMQGQPDGSRYVLALSYLDDPIERGEMPGLKALINVTTRKVVWLRDEGGPILRSDNDEGPLNPDRLEPTRPAPKPLKMTMPEGPTWTMEGNLVSWQNWRFRLGSDPRTGLVLYTIGYDDGTKLRPVLYRASLSELFVPYGDPNHLMINYFDAGEFGMNTAFPSSFVPMNDAPENARFFPVVSHDFEGRPQVLGNSVAIYEIDGGILWRHGGQSRRARNLVVASIHRAGNYDYNFKWIFHQDGTIEQEVDLSGFMATRMVERDKDPDALHTGAGKGVFGTLVAPKIEASNHQHFFSFRLDMDVDGPVKNQIFEMNVESGDAKDSNQPNAIVMRETLLKTEDSAKRNVNMPSHRTWKIVNPAVRNRFNQPSAYMIIPGETAVPYAAKDSFLRRISGFTEHQIWVTPYDPGQLYAAGNYVFDGALDDGLPFWTAKNRSIEFEDVVIYYTVGVTHVPRVEDWPIMSAHHAGFKLVPAGFFSSNPAIGVPPTRGGN